MVCGPYPDNPDELTVTIYWCSAIGMTTDERHARRRHAEVNTAPPAGVFRVRLRGSPQAEGRDLAMRALAYYSCDGGESAVYHSYRQCPVGRDIPLLCRRRGTNGLERCSECVSMDRAEVMPAVAVVAAAA
jgi:hypothetical protein